MVACGLFSSLVASWALQFSNAVGESINDVQQGLLNLTSALTSESVHTLQQFMEEIPHPRSIVTRYAWTRARDCMVDVSKLQTVCIH